MTFLGIIAYKRFFFGLSWRTLYIFTTVLTTIFSSLQFMLIFRVNRTVFHLSDFFFAMGDDVIGSYISGIQFLPICIMYTSLCPSGTEGSTYAMLTTFSNLALTCAFTLGTSLSLCFDVRNSTLAERDVSGLWRLNLLTSIIAPLPLALLCLLPKNSEQTTALRNNGERSTAGGLWFLVTLIAALIWTMAVSIQELR